MRRIINSTYVSLDGLIELLERWHFEYLDEASAKVEADQLSACDALLMGRRTYEVFAEAWPPRTGDIADSARTEPRAAITAQTES
jgi:dihydrofolate reductase